MFISRLFIKNFRNLRHLDVEIGQGVTCFIGENNSGKTNLFHALRLVLDGNISAQRRRLQPEDLAAGLTFAQPEHVLISVEFSDFAGRPNEEALPFTAVLENGKARLSYRFRPKATTRDALEQIPEGGPIPGLKIDDYVWEIAAGGDNIDLNTVSWNESFGTRFSTATSKTAWLLLEPRRSNRSWNSEIYRMTRKLGLFSISKRRMPISMRVQPSAPLAPN
jgi:putative ATP-dependent endonuclease of OLD family